MKRILKKIGIDLEKRDTLGVPEIEKEEVVEATKLDEVPIGKSEKEDLEEVTEEEFFEKKSPLKEHEQGQKESKKTEKAYRKRDKKINFYVNEEEKKRIDFVKNGMKLDYRGLYLLLLEGAKVEKKVSCPEENERLKEVAYELKKIGNNVNQLAKVANISGEIEREKLDKIEKELRNLWQYLKQ